MVCAAGFGTEKRHSNEGVFFRPTAGGTEVRLHLYVVVFPKTIQAQISATLTAPPRLIIRYRPRQTQPHSTEFLHDETLTSA